MSVYSRITLIFAVFVFILPAPLFSQGFIASRIHSNSIVFLKDSTAVKTPKGALYRSLTFPGWGQWYNRKKLKSAIIFSAEVSCITGYIIQNSRLSNSKTSNDREYYRTDRNKFVWWFSGVVLYSGLDSYIDAYLRDFKKDMATDFGQFQISPFLTIQIDISLITSYIK